MVKFLRQAVETAEQPKEPQQRNRHSTFFEDSLLWAGIPAVAAMLYHGGEIKLEIAGYAVVGLVAMLLSKLLTGRNLAQRAEEKGASAWNLLTRKLQRTDEPPRRHYASKDEVVLGYAYDGHELPKQKRPYVFRRLAYMKNTGFFATSQFGKSTFVNTLLFQMIGRMSPDEFQLAIIDGKGVDYTQYTAIKNLFCPVAQEREHDLKVLRAVHEEVKQRARWMRTASEKTLMPCGHLTEYHKLMKANPWLEAEHGLPPQLPELILIVDEVQKVLTSKETEKLLIYIASTGMGLGVKIWVTTQYNKVDVLPNLVQKNLPVLHIGYMGRGRSSYNVGGTEIPAEVDLDPITAGVKGRFLIMDESEPSYIEVDAATPQQIHEAIVKNSTGIPLRWDDEPMDETAVVGLSGSMEQKRGTILAHFPDEPEPQEFAERFGTTTRTFHNWKARNIWG